MKDLRRYRHYLPYVIFLVLLVSYIKSRVLTPFDSAWSIHTAVSILEERNVDLDEYRDLIKPNDYRTIEVDGHLYNRYPVGPAVVAVPVVYAVSKLYYRVFLERFTSYLKRASPQGVERFVASIIVALTALVIFAIGRLRQLSIPLALVLVFIFAYCTSSWSVASRALWQHGPSMLMLAGTLYYLLRAEPGDRRMGRVGLLLAASYTMRPTNALSVLVLSAYVAWKHRAGLPRFLAGAAVVAVPFVWLSLATEGRLLPWYFFRSQNFLGPADPKFWGAAAGTLLSPGRGLLVYSPVFLLVAAGVWLKVRQRRWQALDGCLLAIIAGHWLLISSWTNWWGGSSYGPRLLADLIPYLIYFLIPVLASCGAAQGWRRTAWATALVLTIGVSFAMHRVGASRYATWDWNVVPNRVKVHPERLWDWHDPPFLRTEAMSLDQIPRRRGRKARRDRSRRGQAAAPGQSP